MPVLLVRMSLQKAREESTHFNRSVKQLSAGSMPGPAVGRRLRKAKEEIDGLDAGPGSGVDTQQGGRAVEPAPCGAAEQRIAETPAAPAGRAPSARKRPLRRRRTSGA